MSDWSTNPVGSTFRLYPDSACFLHFHCYCSKPSHILSPLINCGILPNGLPASTFTPFKISSSPQPVWSNENISQFMLFLCSKWLLIDSKEKPEPHYKLQGFLQSSQLITIASLTSFPSTCRFARSASATLTSLEYFTHRASLLPQRLCSCSSCRGLLGACPLLLWVFVQTLPSQRDLSWQAVEKEFFSPVVSSLPKPCSIFSL